MKCGTQEAQLSPFWVTMAGFTKGAPGSSWVPSPPCGGIWPLTGSNGSIVLLAYWCGVRKKGSISSVFGLESCVFHKPQHPSAESADIADLACCTLREKELRCLYGG